MGWNAFPLISHYIHYLLSLYISHHMCVFSFHMWYGLMYHGKQSSFKTRFSATKVILFATSCSTHPFWMGGADSLRSWLAISVLVFLWRAPPWNLSVLQQHFVDTLACFARLSTYTHTHNNHTKVVILSYAEHGSLSSFLEGKANRGSPLQIDAKLKLAVDIARGMQFLASKHFIHR